MPQCTYHPEFVISANQFVNWARLSQSCRRALLAAICGLTAADSLLRTADQRHFGLLTNCGLGNLLRTAKLTAANCELRTTAWAPRKDRKSTRLNSSHVAI